MPERQPSIAVRISLCALLVVLLSPLGALVTLVIVSPRLAQGVARAFGPVVVILVIAAIMLARRVFFPGWESPPGSSDNDGGGGGGSGPREPPAPSGAPSGGLPLPDAEQSPHRVRDHNRPERRRLRLRRPAREPERSPARIAPHRQRVAARRLRTAPRR
jgi:hypothetical protein